MENKGTGFDRNSLIGLVLIGVILLLFSLWNSNEESDQISEEQRVKDSIARVEKQQAPVVEKDTTPEPIDTVTQAVIEPIDSLQQDSVQQTKDSLDRVTLINTYGDFADAVNGTGQDLILENDEMIATISTKGGALKSIQLKNYVTYDSLPLYLFDDSSSFDMSFETKKAGILSTSSFYFEALSGSKVVTEKDSDEVRLRLYAGNKEQYLEYVYSLAGTSNMLHFDVNFVGLEEVMAPSSNDVFTSWTVLTPNQEKTRKNQERYTTAYYRFAGGDVDYISESKDDEEALEAPVQWVAFKEQFFTAAVIAEQGFGSYGSKVSTKKTNGGNYIKELKAEMSIPYKFEKEETFAMKIYAGPNSYSKLKEYDLELEEVVPLGWGIFGWVNQFIVIPVFNFLDGFDLGYGLIIFLLTLFIKIILLPIFYKTTLSSQRMKVLKPDIAKINEKYKDDSMKKQQATMDLYRKAGVSPLAGCIPMLIQMPILIAMFRFFPASIELRQQSFLWADDLSTYDSIFEWTAEIPLLSSFYGNHISLFTIMMAVSLFFYTRINMQFSSGQIDGPMGKQMKIMTNFMPVMMLFFFNSYAAGLCYYYFLANLMSIIQTYIIKRYFVNEEAIRAKIEAHKKNPKKHKKKSGFAKRLEEVAKQQQQKQQQGKGRKR